MRVCNTAFDPGAMLPSSSPSVEVASSVSAARIASSSARREADASSSLHAPASRAQQHSTANLFSMFFMAFSVF